MRGLPYSPSPVVALFLPVLAYLAVHQPYEQYAEYGEYQQYDAGVEVVAFHAAPHFEYEFGAVAEVTYHGAALHDFPVGILYGIDLQAVRTYTFTEEVAEVGTRRDGGVPFGFHDFGGGNGADVTYGVHIAQGDAGLAEIVDEVGGSLGITRVFGDYPAVVPDVAAFARHFVGKVYAYRFGFLDGPYGIAAPGEVEPGLVLGHHLLAEIGFPTGNIGLHGFQILLGQGYGFGGVVVHQLLHGDGAVGKPAGVGVDDGGSVGVAIAVFHQDFTLVLGVPKAVPAAGFVGGDEVAVVQDAGRAPHIWYGIVGGGASRLTGLVQLPADVGGDVGQVVRGLAEVAVDGQEKVLLQHPFDDVFRGAHHVEVFVAALYLGEHDFVDVKHLVDKADVLPRLLLVPGGELGKYVFVDVVRPVVDFQYVAALFARVLARGGCEDEAKEKEYVC